MLSSSAVFPCSHALVSGEGSSSTSVEIFKKSRSVPVPDLRLWAWSHRSPFWSRDILHLNPPQHWQMHHNYKNNQLCPIFLLKAVIYVWPLDGSLATLWKLHSPWCWMDPLSYWLANCLPACLSTCLPVCLSLPPVLPACLIQQRWVQPLKPPTSSCGKNIFINIYKIINQRNAQRATSLMDDSL